MKSMILLLAFLLEFAYAINHYDKAPPFTSETRRTIGVDTTLMVASDLYLNGDFAASFSMYKKLYDLTKNPLFTKYLAMNAFAMGDNDTALLYAKKYAKDNADKDSVEIDKILADNYLKSGQLKKALEMVKKVQKSEDSLLVNTILSSIYIELKDYKRALKIMEKIYDATHSERSLEQIIALEMELKNQGAARTRLKEHIKEFGCGKQLCAKALQIFIDKKDIKRLYELQSTIYDASPNDKNAELLISIMIERKLYNKAIKIAKDHGNLEWQMQIYAIKGNYKKAGSISKEIYKQTGQTIYLAMGEIYRYEGLSLVEKQSKAKILQIVAAIEDAIEIGKSKDKLNHKKTKSKKRLRQDGVLYNFMAYVLIDKNINVLKGINYAKKAIDIEPISEYIDTLAWGYYKMGECKKATFFMDKIPKSRILEQKELQEHSKAIKKLCKMHKKGKIKAGIKD